MVTLELTVFEERDLSAVRQLFPHAEERIEVFGEQLEGLVEDAKVVEFSGSIFRTTYPTMQEAREGCRLLPHSVGIHLEGSTVLHEDEYEALAEYHSRRVLTLDYVIDHNVSCNDLCHRNYHDQRLVDLGAVLGNETMQRIYDKTKRTFDPRTKVVRSPASAMHTAEEVLDVLKADPKKEPVN